MKFPSRIQRIGMNREQIILHLNIVDFAAAVEELCDSSLRGRPFIIAPAGERALVYDMSEEAYRQGVRKQMPLRMARKRCPDARLLLPSPDRYRKALHRCFVHACSFTPKVECAPGSGHLYLDLTGTSRLFGPPPDIAWRLRKRLRKDPGVDPIWTIGPSRLISKVASRLVKPLGEYIVAAGEEKAFLAPLDPGLLPSITPDIRKRLRELNIRTIAQAAQLSRQHLFFLCGQQAVTVYNHLRGIDCSPVVRNKQHSGFFTLEHQFSQDSDKEETVRPVLFLLASELASRLRTQQLGCRSLCLTLVHSDAVQVRRRAASSMPDNTSQHMRHLAQSALCRAWHRRIRIRRVLLSCERPCPMARQLSLFASINHRQQRLQNLDRAVDQIRSTLGPHLLFQASSMGKGKKPLLPA